MKQFLLIYFSKFIIINKNRIISIIFSQYIFFPSFLPLGATAQVELWPPEQSASIFRYSEANCLVSEQFSFYGVRLLASRPTPNLEDQGIPLRMASTS
jgi:hypothetical protein